MALPTKVIEQLSRAPARTPGWSSRVLLFSATFFILSLGVFLGIQFGYRPFLEGQVIKLDKDIEEFSSQVTPSQQEELVTFYSQLDNLNNLLAHQVQTSKIFRWTEANTNAQVQLTGLSFTAGTKTLVLSGQARTIVNLGEQLNRFQAQPEVMNLQLSQLALDQRSGGWNFNVSLVFREKFLNPDPATVQPIEDTSTDSSTSLDSSASSSDQTVTATTTATSSQATATTTSQ